LKAGAAVNFFEENMMAESDNILTKLQDLSLCWATGSRPIHFSRDANGGGNCMITHNDGGSLMK
jgi:hypothetical protein